MSAPPSTEPPVLIPHAVAVASIATWSFSFVVLVPFLAFRVAPQAFPRSNRHRFIASESSLRYVHIRARLLFALTLATMLDALNNATHFTIAWLWGKYITLAHRLVLPVTFSPLPSLAVLSLCYRCAVIIVSDQVQRTRYVKGSQVACIGAWALHAAGVLVMTYSMITDGVPPNVQLLDRWVPLWGTAGTAVLPILAVGGSAWSLRLAYDGRRQRKKMRGAAEDDHTSHVVIGAAKTDQWHSAERESSVLATVKDCDGSQVPTSTSATASLSRSLVAGVSPTTLTLSRSPGPINYPLTKTFRILTYGIFTTWVLATILLLFPMVGPIRNNALFNFIMTMTIALESSFEQLLKRHNRRAIPQRRVGGEADRAREEKTTRVGNGNGEMVGESLLDVAGEFLNRTNQ